MKSKTLALLSLALVVACSANSAIQRSREYSAVGNYFQARHLLREEAARVAQTGGTPSADLAEALRIAERDFALDRARALIFADRELEGLQGLMEAELAGVDANEVARWQARARHKLAAKNVGLGDAHFTAGLMQDALASYLKALEYEADFPTAMEGAERVREAVSRLTARAQQQFLEAVRKLPEFRYFEVHWHAVNATENDPKREDAKQLQQQARQQLLANMMTRAKELQQAELFGAALVEYKSVSKLDATYPGAAAAIVAMENEVKAAQLVGKAKLEMRSERFAQARQLLSDALACSELSRAGIGELQMQCETLRGEAAYRAARDLEIQGKKQQALLAYEGLVAEWPKGIADEVARAQAMKVDLDGAKTEWAAAEAAEAAGKAAEALDHYENVQRFCADWQDVRERIARLKSPQR